MTGAASRRRVTVAVAAVCAGIDLGVKLVVDGTVQHPRSTFLVVLGVAIACALIAIVPRLPSRAAAIAGGLGAGGAIGNAVAAVSWSGGIPDPLVLSLGLETLAFNLADVFALCGAWMLVVTAGLYALRYPEALRRPL